MLTTKLFAAAAVVAVGFACLAPRARVTAAPTEGRTIYAFAGPGAFAISCDVLGMADHPPAIVVNRTTEDGSWLAAGGVVEFGHRKRVTRTTPTGEEIHYRGRARGSAFDATFLRTVAGDATTERFVGMKLVLKGDPLAIYSSPDGRSVVVNVRNMTVRGGAAVRVTRDGADVPIDLPIY